MGLTKIEWCSHSVNPLTGCERLRLVIVPPERPFHVTENGDVLLVPNIIKLKCVN